MSYELKRRETIRERSAFTLVELLVAITVLAILASLILVALARANESAREAKTRSTIAKINALIMQKYESYRTRRVPVSTTGLTPCAAAQRRLDGLRELMRLEMPDRWSDIFDIPPSVPLAVLPSVPAVTQGYRNTLTAADHALSAPTTDFQDAKCLYLIITRGCDEPDVMEQFAPNEIGVDPADKLSYFLDGWGRPIGFRRWAPGFFSSLQPWNPSASVFPTTHDPFDPLKIYKPVSGDPFYNSAPGSQQNNPPLYPLIYSAGSDGIYELYHGSDHHYAANNNNPYQIADGTEMLLIGALFEPPASDDGVDGRIDNITNHDDSQ